MKALVYENFQGALILKTVPDPTPLSHSVVLRTLATGICRSDWHGWMGHDPDILLPHVPGHELAGEIVAIGKDVHNFKVGQRVTVPFVCGCGHCEQCNSGNQQVCDHQSQPGFTHWGSFAEYVRIDRADINLVVLPDAINNETAAALGCRFITAYRAVVDQGHVDAGQFVAIHGCGGVGLSAIMIAKARGATVIAIDINTNALKLAKELGADFTLNPNQETKVVEAVKMLSKGGVHVSMDALGNAVTCQNSIGNLRKRGKHLQVGLMTGKHQHPQIPMDQVIAKELEIIGSHGMQAHRYDEMLSLIVKGQLHPEKLIEKTIELQEAGEVLQAMDKYEHYGMTIINSF
ncbi:MAG: zinc-dependent alcohol dehydrogenase family protein [Croceitalea sp.]|nr:zinc-dependent alcohol dehydrogenase family protein [Croceitalea sp.]MBT8238102.1 zinc-dependent alcohol dehydrogenase family protein [Croceitalea sp.]NNC34306.1 zinc-dependent alcohol dehydrogenase family protein [Croceitalea sp.]NNL09963.1 zinc-dependent alcohol dehydrogenase family protein [Croceitalea sp.]NNM18166.1 zinc-dependent alcohol dehydrogenase family protein [Croceitalea sp.]